MPVTRRATLGGLGAAVALGRSSVSFGASSSSAARLVVLNIRGGLDGLATVIPYGDPALAGLRAGLVPQGLVKVDDMFALHPSLRTFYAMMQARQALVVHAVGPLVQIRSHFAGQDYLQSGAAQLLSSGGWLNRTLGLLDGTSGLSMSIETPLLMQGAVTAKCYAPEPYAQAPSRLTSQLVALTAADSQWGPAQATALSDRMLFNSVLGASDGNGQSSLWQLSTVAGALLASPQGPRVAALDCVGADTHDDQNNRVPTLLMEIDNALAALKKSLGAAWANTVVLTMTEFGRTAYQNGTQGSDHGTGFAVLLAGGAVAGGRVVAKWPGLGSAQLFQGRDLAPTVDFRSVAMGVLMSHMGISPSAQPIIFPGSSSVTPMLGLTS